MARTKAALFVDNADLFRGMQSLSRYLVKTGELVPGQYLRMRLENLIGLLEEQGVDLFARHFFATVPPLAYLNRLQRLPTDAEWEEMVSKAVQNGFFKIIQGPPFNFQLHAVPVKLYEVPCGSELRRAWYRCQDAAGEDGCGQKLDLDYCAECRERYLIKEEKGVDATLAAQLAFFAARTPRLEQVTLVAGKEEYAGIVRFLRRELGLDVRVACWRRVLSGSLEREANLPSLILDGQWKTVCEARMKRTPEDEALERGEAGAREEENLLFS